MHKLSENFDKAEFKCNCGCNGDFEMSQDLILLLEDIRAQFNGNAIKINSGYRCAEHNKKEGGKPNSKHLRDWDGIVHAADIVVANTSPGKVQLYIKVKQKGKGIGLGLGKNFTHVDIRKQSATWSY
jgi:uncharacterized protein YcbK (DUF882 family)